MVAYAPWRQKLVNFVLSTAREKLYLLDVQLGSECNARCPRCDSSCASSRESASLDIETIRSFGERIDQELSVMNSCDRMEFFPFGMTEGFVCGLGEPTAGKNLTKLKALVESTCNVGIRWSAFTNGIYWDDDIERYLMDGRLSVMVQYNSRKPDLAREMLGVGAEEAAMHMRNRMRLRKLAKQSFWYQYSKGKYTSVAASIVLERDNFEEIPEILAENLRDGIFPLLGELERAGYAQNEYHKRHSLTASQLDVLHDRASGALNEYYAIPVCPAAIGAIHVNNNNIVTVDKFTGLSCGWFGMGDPEVYEIGDIREMSYDEIVHDILRYRESRIKDVEKAVSKYPETVFGGCGGSARVLLPMYLSIYN